jgi:hypothetical protein
MRTTASSGAIHQFSFTLGPHGASRRAAVIAAAYTALVGLFPSQTAALDDSYAASLAALSDDSGGIGSESRERGIDWGTEVAQAVLRLARDRWVQRELSSVHRWDRGGPVAADTAAFGPMSAQGWHSPRCSSLIDNTQFRPGPPRGLTSAAYTNDFSAVKALGRKTGSTRTEDQTALAPFWEGNASTHWNQAANQMARANHLVYLRQQPASRSTEHRHGRHRVHHLER